MSNSVLLETRLIYRVCKTFAAIFLFFSEKTYIKQFFTKKLLQQLVKFIQIIFCLFHENRTENGYTVYKLPVFAFSAISRILKVRIEFFFRSTSPNIRAIDNTFVKIPCVFFPNFLT